jgi:hypothetical protein
VRLDEVTAEIRPRSDWEAVDLGFAMVRRDFWRCFSVWWLALALPTAVASYFLWDYPLLVLMLFWWAKPAGSRLVLFEISRRLFGEQPCWRAVWRELLRAWLRRFFYRFMWARFSPWLAVTMAVEDLEGLRGIGYRQRCQQVLKRGEGAVMGIYFSAELIAAWLALAILGLAKMLIPDGQGTAWQTALEAWDRTQPLEFPLLILRTIAGCAMLAMSLTDLFVTGSGFGIYLNNRTWIEGWDVELAFKRMAQRLAKIGLLVMMATLVCGLVNPSLAAEPQTPTARMEEVKASPDFKIHSEIRRVPKDKPKPPTKPWKLWNFDLGPYAADLFKLCLAVILVGLLGWLIWRYRHVFRIRGNFERPDRTKLKVKTVMGMAIIPTSLPADVPTAVWNLWLQGLQHQALALLYRASISRLIEHGAIEIQESDTEGDCLRRVESTADFKHTDYFRWLTGAWSGMAYAGLIPSDEMVQQFCQQWPFERSTGR